MSIASELITTYNKAQRFRKLFASSRSFHCKSLPAQKTFVYDKLFKLIPCKLVPVYVQSLHFSISTFLKTDCKTMCKGDKRTLNVYYKDILEAQKNNTLIIDVREQSEIDETGKLPGSIHIPMGDVTNTLTSLSDKDFRDKFTRDKPSKDTKIILSCRSGKRSGIVQEEMQKLGYENTYNYVGGWLDWENNQKV